MIEFFLNRREHKVRKETQRRSLRIMALLALIAVSIISKDAYADDPGITKARLIQQTDSTYMMEIDIAQQLLYTLKTPVFPARFMVSEPELENQSGWLTIRFMIKSSGAGLGPDDELLLPWMRNGADVTVQWLDGSIFKGLFNRSLEGIKVPMSELMPTTKTTREVVTEGLRLGLTHGYLKGIHIVFILALFLAIRSKKSISYLLLFSIGQALALVLIEIGVPGFDLLFSDILILILASLLAANAYQSSKNIKPYKYLLLMAGIIHGLSFNQDILGMDLPTVQRVQALFAFNLGIDILHFIIFFIAWGIWLIVGDRTKLFKWSSALSGGVSICILLILFQENVLPGKTEILDLKKSNSNITIPTGKINMQNQARRGASIMNTPVMVYLSIEPYEIRQEILIQAEAVTEGLEEISIDLQEELKQQVLNSIIENNTLTVDDDLVPVAERNVDFVTLSSAGVNIREVPISERVQEAIIGVTLIYDIESYPDEANVEWSYFPENTGLIEASAIDQNSSITINLSPTQNLLQWQSKMVGYQVPVIEQVNVEQQKIPWISISIFILLAVYIVYGTVKKKELKNSIYIPAIIIAFICYPFVRTQTGLTGVPNWKPSKERTSIVLDEMLTNVYRAFDRRKEDDVYDRLALSVTGDQLTEIYIQNRMAMALENRGGARANVDQVEVLDVYSIDRSEQGFVVDALWTVNGSVNHFGHTHYRQNQYRALVTLVIFDDTWKISKIETLDERRLL